MTYFGLRQLGKLFVIVSVVHFAIFLLPKTYVHSVNEALWHFLGYGPANQEWQSSNGGHQVKSPFEDNYSFSEPVAKDEELRGYHKGQFKSKTDGFAKQDGEPSQGKGRKGKKRQERQEEREQEQELEQEEPEKQTQLEQKQIEQTKLKQEQDEQGRKEKLENELLGWAQPEQEQQELKAVEQQDRDDQLVPDQFKRAHLEQELHEQEQQGQLGPSGSLVRPRDRPWSEDTHIDVRFPNITSFVDEPILCTAVPVPHKQAWITGISNLASTGSIHHVIVHLCNEPALADPLWNCEPSKTPDPQWKESHVCRGVSRMVYCWDDFPKGFYLPQDMGIAVGQRTKARYLVFNAHYRVRIRQADQTGVRVHLTLKEPERQAGMLSMSRMSPVPPKSTLFNDYVCKLNVAGSYTLYAFYYHTHHLGRLVSAYKVNEDKQWQLIGQHTPYGKQVIYPTSTADLVVRKGDLLAVRCVIENTRSHTVEYNAKFHGEMCTTFIYYYVNGEKRIDVPGHLLDCVEVNEEIARPQIGYFPALSAEWNETIYEQTFKISFDPKSKEAKLRKLRGRG